MLVLSSTLHRATTTALQRTAPVPEIIDTPVYLLLGNERQTSNSTLSFARKQTMHAASK
jgi:hypothetical protein